MLWLLVVILVFTLLLHFTPVQAKDRKNIKGEIFFSMANLAINTQPLPPPQNGCLGD